MKIKKGDKVMVMKGKDAGKSGVIEKAFPKEGKVLILGVNLRKKHEKARKEGQKGQTVERPMPLQASNVMIIDPKGGKPTRTTTKMVGDKKVRIAKKSGAELA